MASVRRDGAPGLGGGAATGAGSVVVARGVIRGAGMASSFEGSFDREELGVRGHTVSRAARGLRGADRSRFTHMC
ncbi:hypothetical protein GCM10027070_06090 [Barrientosiimonas humi]